MTRDQLLAKLTRLAKAEGYDLHAGQPNGGTTLLTLSRRVTVPVKKRPEYVGDKWDEWKEVET